LQIFGQEWKVTATIIPEIKLFCKQLARNGRLLPILFWVNVDKIFGPETEVSCPDLVKDERFDKTF
jgi:hypothetical protein